MKGRILLLSMLFVAVFAFGQNKKLVILHTNDTHSQIYPFNPNMSDTLRAGRGGFVRRVNLVKEERMKNPDLLLFDSGDFSQGSSYYTMFKGDVEIGLMNLMRYDAAVIGNHEFDFGMDNMIRLFKKAKFPFVCANYDFTGTELEKIVKPYIIIKRNGLKIGVFGLSPKMEGLIAEKNYGTLKYIDPVKAAQKAIDALKAKKCDLIICLSHLGWNIEGDNEMKLIGATKGIDIVLGGHSHTFLKKMEYVKDLSGKMVGADQNGKSGIYIGRIEVDMKKVNK